MSSASRIVALFDIWIAVERIKFKPVAKPGYLKELVNKVIINFRKLKLTVLKRGIDFTYCVFAFRLLHALALTSEPKMKMIAAACEGLGIGKNGDLPWRLKA